MQEFVDYYRKNGFIPNSGHSVIKCNISFTKKDYAEKFLTFIRNEKYRSGVRTSARIQPFCRKYNINNGYFNGKEITPGTITKRNKVLFIHKNQFRLFW